MATTVNERNTAYLQVTLRDKDGALALPTAAMYRVDCMTTGEAVRAQTALTPASSMEIVLTADDNAMRNPANRSEQRRVTVVATYGAAADQATAEFDYVVADLRFVG